MFLRVHYDRQTRIKARGRNNYLNQKGIYLEAYRPYHAEPGQETEIGLGAITSLTEESDAARLMIPVSQIDKLIERLTEMKQVYDGQS